ncbi:unnamed protein product [Prorocentrum cordatum]|uniref:Uncharacterized protein n=1 Tax=Prorocentrum cordatum TaxID=2364126 RepID=A0ABN9R0Y9_9DINO|nr:unnamed protein product [Polarella glacialis]
MRVMHGAEEEEVERGRKASTDSTTYFDKSAARKRAEDEGRSPLNTITIVLPKHMRAQSMKGAARTGKVDRRTRKWTPMGKSSPRQPQELLRTSQSIPGSGGTSSKGCPRRK